MKYNWLLFDADGTLFDYDRAESVALKTTFEECGEDCHPAIHSKYNQINNRLFKDLEKGRITSTELRTKRFERLFSEFNINLETTAFSKAYLSNLSKHSDLIPGALDTIRHLHPSCKMLIVTNGISDVQRPRFDRSAIKPYFFDYLISDEIGVAKPAKEFFDVVFGMMKYPDKGNVLIVGDSLTSDMTGGINYGIDTCWYNPHQIRNENNLKISYEIGRLQDLIKIVTT